MQDRAPERPTRIPFHWKLFDPIDVFGIAADFLAPLRYPAKLILPAAALAGMTAYSNWYDMMRHLDRIFLTWSFFQLMCLSILTVNLFSKLSLALVMSYKGADPRDFGVRLMFGVLPGFYVLRGPINRLDAADRPICCAAPLLAKLTLFSVGILMWGVLGRSGSGLADVFLALGSAAFGSFLLLGNPLWRAEGYFWVSAKLRRPKLREHAFKLIRLLTTFQKPPAALSAAEAWALAVYAFASIGFTAFLIFSVLYGIAYALEAELRGTGVVLFCVMLGMAALFWVSLRSVRREAAAARKA
ncbi:MAG: hypothetical protein AAGI51_14850 [Pseudomonadota bacterium]